MDEVFNRLTAWLAPILCLPLRKLGNHAIRDIENSVHLRSYDPVPSEWHNIDVAKKMGADSKGTPSGNECIWKPPVTMARLVLHCRLRQRYLSRRICCWLFADQDAASIFITSSAILTMDTARLDAFRLDTIDGIAVGFSMAEGEKNAPGVGKYVEVSVVREICDRCHNVITKFT